MVEARISSLKETKPQEYLIRFVAGGIATALAGLVAKHFGPYTGGLFLAFPAIFPATATLIESHEKNRMGMIGHDGTNRGRMAASIDAAGAALGCVGLIGFALILYWFLSGHRSWAVLMTACCVWFALSFVLWEVRKTRLFGLRVRMLR